MLNAGTSIGQTFGERASSAIRTALGRVPGVVEGIVGTVRRILTRGFQGLALAVGGVLALSLRAGFQRFTQIQDATQALTITLGDAARAGEVMNDVLKTVEGTPFTLPQFATVAKILAGVGVEAARIPPILSAIGDAAALMGGGAEVVGQLANAFTDAATLGRITGETINSLSLAGVPALKILANTFGVTTEEMRKMVSQGAIPAQEGIDALVRGIKQGTKGIAGETRALGGLAQSLGNTVSGSFQNMINSFARFGAGIISAFGGTPSNPGALVQVFQSIRSSVLILGEAVASVAERVERSPGFQRFLAEINAMPAAVQAAVDAFQRGGLSAAIQTFTDQVDFAQFARRLLDKIGGAFEALPAERIAQFLVRMFTRAFGVLASQMAFIVSSLVPALVSALPGIATGFVQGLLQAFAANPVPLVALIAALGIPGLGPALAGSLRSIFRIIPFGGIIGDPMVRGFQEAGKKITPRIGRVIADILGKVAVPSRALAGPLTTSVQTGVAAASPGILATIGSALGSLGTALTGVVGGLATVLGGAIVVAIAAALAGIGVAIFAHRQKIGAALQAVGGFIADFFTRTLPRLLGDAIGTIGNFFTSIPQRISDFFRGLSWEDVGRVVTTALLNVFFAVPGLLIRAAIRWGPAVVSAITSGFQAVVGFFANLPSQIMNAISTLGPRLVDFGATALSRMASAIGTGVGAVVRFFQLLPGRVIGAIVSLPGLLANLGSRALSAMANAVRSGGAAVVNFFVALPGRVRSALANLVSEAFSIGQRIIQGIVNGIRSIGGRIKDALLGLARGAWQAVKDFILPGSPSRLFAETIGRPIGEGILAGIRSTAPGLLSYAGGLASALNNAIASGLQVPIGPRIGGAVAATAGGATALVGGPSLADGSASVVAAVQQLASVISELPTSGAGVVLNEGAVQVTPRQADPEAVAQSVVARIARVVHP
jgi:tape measure domain-containing protein